METKQATSKENKRPIYADDLKERLLNYEAQGGHRYFREGANMILHEVMPNIIDACPTADILQMSWTPVTSGLPNQWLDSDPEYWGEPMEFIVLIKDAKCATTLNFDGKNFFDQETREIYPVTHWMEMPDLPQKNEQPTGAAAQVIHGHWDEGVYHDYCCCSNCRDVYILAEWLTDGKWNYCPNCGAKMDGGAPIG